MDLTPSFSEVVEFVLSHSIEEIAEHTLFQKLVTHQSHLLLHGSLFYDSTVADDYYTFDDLPDLCEGVLRMCREKDRPIYARFADKLEGAMTYYEIRQRFHTF